MYSISCDIHRSIRFQSYYLTINHETLEDNAVCMQSICIHFFKLTARYVSIHAITVTFLSAMFLGILTSFLPFDTVARFPFLKNETSFPYLRKLLRYSVLDGWRTLCTRNVISRENGGEKCRKWDERRGEFPDCNIYVPYLYISSSTIRFRNLSALRTKIRHSWMSVGATKGNANCYVKHNFQRALVHIAFYINSREWL